MHLARVDLLQAQRGLEHRERLKEVFDE